MTSLRSQSSVCGEGTGIRLASEVVISKGMYCERARSCLRRRIKTLSHLSLVWAGCLGLFYQPRVSLGPVVGEEEEGVSLPPHRQLYLQWGLLRQGGEEVEGAQGEWPSVQLGA